MRTKPSENSTESSTKKADKRPGLALYIHIPFCASKCRYCDFNSYPLQKRPTRPYLEALAKEIDARASQNPSTIFVGGGTPSILPPEEIREFLDHLQKATNFRNSTKEITFECNPESLTLEKAKTLLDCGVNRLSIGVQSFQKELLEFYDRAHDAEQAKRAYFAAREAGFQNINLDLIFCAPGQTLENWQSDLSQALALKPDHIAAYDLIFEEGTTLLKWKESGKVQPNEEEMQAQMYRYTMSELARAGFDRYEISNYARDGKRCLHNINYWKNGSYIGLGAGAVSYCEGKRQKNPSLIDAYIQAIDQGGGKFEEEEMLEKREKLGETMMLRLRLVEGISRSEILEETGFDLAEVYKEPIQSLTKEGLILFDSEKLQLTERGLLLGDLVASRFL